MARRDLIRYQLLLPRGRRARARGIRRPAGRQQVVAARAGAYGPVRPDLGQLPRIGRDGDVGLQSLALFVRNMLTVNAPLADEDEASRAIGRDRFATFVARVGRQLAAGRLTLVPEEDA